MGNLIYSIAISTHLGMSGDFNNVHPRITIEHSQLIAGVFYNSESQISAFVGKQYQYHNIQIETGVVTGYSGANVVPMIKLNYNNFFVAPGYANNDAGLVMGYEVQF